MSAEEFLDRQEEIGPSELIRGKVVHHMPAGEEHGSIGMEAAYHIMHHVRTRDLGRVYAAETGFHLEYAPDTVRGPDVAFVAKDRVVSTTGFSPVVPDLVVEVKSPRDTLASLRRKMSWWLEKGVREGWMVEPSERKITVFDAVGERVVRVEDTLRSEVLAGFELRLGELFR